MSRLLHLVAGNLYGGVETFMRTLAETLARHPDPPREFALCFEGRLARELRATGATVHLVGEVRVRRPWTVLRARRGVKRLLRSRPFGLAVTHGCWPHVVFAPAVKAAGTPLAFFAHDRLEGRHWLERWARRTTPDVVLANSRFTLPAAEALFPGVRSRVYYAPVPPVATADRAATRARVRAALGAPGDAVVVACASRLEPWKGHALLIEALARVADPRWVAWIAGAPQRPSEERYLADLVALARSRGLEERVRFLGHRSDVPDLLVAADLHCQPNVSAEPFGRVFVEALYAGLPVVTTALGGALEIVTGDVGVLVAPEADALAGALARLIADPGERARLGRGGPERARALCEPAARIAELRAIIDETGLARSGA